MSAASGNDQESLQIKETHVSNAVKESSQKEQATSDTKVQVVLSRIDSNEMLKKIEHLLNNVKDSLEIAQTSATRSHDKDTTSLPLEQAPNNGKDVLIVQEVNSSTSQGTFTIDKIISDNNSEKTEQDFIENINSKDYLTVEDTNAVSSDNTTFLDVQQSVLNIKDSFQIENVEVDNHENSAQNSNSPEVFSCDSEKLLEDTDKDFIISSESEEIIVNESESILSAEESVTVCISSEEILEFNKDDIKHVTEIKQICDIDSLENTSHSEQIYLSSDDNKDLLEIDQSIVTSCQIQVEQNNPENSLLLVEQMIDARINSNSLLTTKTLHDNNIILNDNQEPFEQVLLAAEGCDLDAFLSCVNSAKKENATDLFDSFIRDTLEDEGEDMFISNNSIDSLQNQLENNGKKSLQTEQIHNNAADSFLDDSTNIIDNEKSSQIDKISTSNVLQTEPTFINDVKESLKTELTSVDDNVQISLLTNQPKIIKNEELTQIKSVSEIKDILSVEKTKESLKDDKTIGISDEELLQIEKSLYDRDISIYERTFIRNDAEFSEIKDAKECSVIKDPKESSEIEDVKESSEIKDPKESTEFEDAKESSEIKDPKESLEIKDVNESVEILATSERNVSHEKIPYIEKIPDTVVTSGVENTFVTNDTNVVSNENLLQVEQNSYAKETNNEVSLLTTLINESNGKLSLEVSNTKDTLIAPNIVVTNDTTEPLISNQTNLISTVESCNFSNFDESFKADQTIVPDDIKILQKDKMTIAIDVNESLKSNKKSTDSIVTESLETTSKIVSDNIEKPKILIDKLQGMNWLKTRSPFDANMSRSTKVLLKNLPRKDERTENYFEGTKKNSNNRRNRSNNSAQNKNRNEKMNNPVSDDKVNNPPKQNNVEQQKKVLQPQQPSVALPSVWNNNTAKQLFPNVQSVVIDRAKEEEEFNLAVAQSICTAQQEIEMRKMAQTSLKIKIQDDPDDNEWGKSHHNLPDTALMESESSNDTNNNQNPAAGFIDKFGRVDGYTEKHLYMGKGARRKEQEFLKAHTENKVQSQNHPGFLQAHPFNKKLTQEVDLQPHQEIKKASNLVKPKDNLTSKNQCTDQIKKEVQLPSRIQERPIHGRSGKEVNFTEADVAMNKNQQKPGFKQGISKDLCQSQKEATSKQTEDFPNRSQECTQRNPSHPYHNQNTTDRSHENVNKSQEHLSNHHSYPTKHHDNINKNQEQTNRQQNHNDRNKRQENLNKQQNYHDNSQDNAYKNQEHYSRDQHYSDRSKDNSKSHNYPDTRQENARCYNYPDRNQDNSRSHNYPDARQDNGRCHNYPDRSQDNSRCHNYPDRSQDNSRNHNYPDRSQDNSRNHNYPDRNQNSTIKNQEPFNSNSNCSDRSCEPVNRNPDRFNRSQNYSNKYEESLNKSQNRFAKNQTEENWDEEECKIPNSSSQKHLDNKGQQIYAQENKKASVNKIADLPLQTDVKNVKQSVNSSLSRSDVTVKQESNTSGSSLGERGQPLQHSTPNTTATASTLKEVNYEPKQNLKTETGITFGTVLESLSSDQRPNVVMTFEGNQNVQRALGLNPNTCNVQTANQYMSKNDASASNVNTINPATIPAYVNSMVQNMPHSQSVHATNFNTDVAYSNSLMNVNAPPFDATGCSISQGLNNQYSVGVESAIPSAPFGFFTAPNVNIPEQLRMNEISNSSQELSRLYNTVSSLSKQLASAQANLLAAQVKFYHEAVSRSPSRQNQLPLQNIAPASETQLLQNQNQPLPTDLVSMNYSVPPGFSASTHGLQKVVQPNAFELPKNFTAVNVQDFTSDKFHPNIPPEQRLNLQSMYIQQGNMYQQQAANFQQYSTNVNAANAIARGRMMPQGNESRELRGSSNQFYNQ